MKYRMLFQAVLVTTLLLLLAANPIRAQEPELAEGGVATLGSAFTYQGQLVYDDAPINDTCDFNFSLWDGIGAGSTQVGSDVLLPDVVVSDGLFTVSLDFGVNAFDGDARWLQINVNCGEGIIELSPPQPLTPSPYALYAADAGLLDGRHAIDFAGAGHNHDATYWSLTGNGSVEPNKEIPGHYR